MTIMLKLTAAKGKPPKRGVDHYWSLIQGIKFGHTFTSREILAASEGTHSDVLDFIRRLLKAGILQVSRHEHTDTGTYLHPRNEILYRCLIRQEATPRVRRDGTLLPGATRQQATWNAIRSPAMRQGFTVDDIVAWGSTDDVKLNRETVRSYVLALASVGYLIALDRGGPNRLATWRLDPGRNTGPLPPMILRAKVVFDQNRHSVVNREVEAEEVPA